MKYVVRVNQVSPLGLTVPGTVYEWRHEGNTTSDALADAYGRALQLEDGDDLAAPETVNEDGPCGWCGTPASHEVHGFGKVPPRYYEIDERVFAPHTWTDVGPLNGWDLRVRLGHSYGTAKETEQDGEKMLKVAWDDDGTRGLLFPHHVEVLS